MQPRSPEPESPGNPATTRSPCLAQMRAITTLQAGACQRCQSRLPAKPMTFTPPPPRRHRCPADAVENSPTLVMGSARTAHQGGTLQQDAAWASAADGVSLLPLVPPLLRASFQLPQAQHRGGRIGTWCLRPVRNNAAAPPRSASCCARHGARPPAHQGIQGWTNRDPAQSAWPGSRHDGAEIKRGRPAMNRAKAPSEKRGQHPPKLSPTFWCRVQGRIRTDPTVPLTRRVHLPTELNRRSTNAAAQKIDCFSRRSCRRLRTRLRA